MSVVEKEMRKNSYSETEKTILNIAALTVGLILIYVFNYERIISVGKWCDVLVKGILDLFLIGCTVYASRNNRRKRNMLLVVTMILYALADSIAAYNVVFSAPFYVAGHLVLIFNLAQTGRIDRKQHMLVLCLMAAGVLLLVIFQKPINAVIESQFTVQKGVKFLIILVWLFYMWILWSKLSFSLHNRFYRASAFLFTASDVLAAFRIISVLPETPYFDVPCYFLAIMFYTDSAFSCEEKEVVTIIDVVDINRRLRQSGIYYCLYGSWALNLSVRRYYAQSARYELAYDVTQLDAIRTLLTRRLGFIIREDHFPVEAKLYSERYGSLTLHGLWHDDEGVVLWLSSRSGGIVMDSEYFRTVHVLGHEIPCLFPVDENDSVLSFLIPEEQAPDCP